MLYSSLVTSACFLSTVTAWSPYGYDNDDGRGGSGHAQPSSSTVANAYIPVQTTCPRQSFLRSSAALSPQEARYAQRRNRKAAKALENWLSKHGDFSTGKQPTLGFASSGGGLRAFLQAAGIVQAFDGRDGDAGTNGLYQAFSYQSGISGGSWFVSTLAGNNWPTISNLRKNLWDASLQALIPADTASSQAAPQYQSIVNDVVGKQNAGFETTIADPFARWVAYGILFPRNVNTYLSSISSFSNFTSYNVPFPLFTSVGVDVDAGQCLPTLATATQYEFNPYEFGSWDAGVQAFTPAKYLGTSLSNGQPVNQKNCTIHFDNLGFTWGSSSNVFPRLYCGTTIEATPFPIGVALEDIVKQAAPESTSDIFAIYPNPFYASPASSLVDKNKNLYLVDGGFVGTDIPIWPLIQKPRNIDVIFAADISEDTADNFPNGAEMRFIYDQAQAAGLTKMPFIPTADVFAAQGLAKRATFFGCGETGTSTIIYLPNVAYTFPSNQSSLRVAYTPADTDAMIANGVLIGTQNNDPEWSFCLACGIKNRDAELPQGCQACLDKYCYKK